MEKDYIEILGVYPGMYASKFKVRQDSWDHYCDHYMNSSDHGTCFLPCKDTDGDTVFVDMMKLLAFYVLIPEPAKKTKKPKKKPAA